MMPEMAHRGPDGDGIQIDERAALGHWRLSILDPTDAGAQPMARDGVWLVHNGEVYNYLELARELESIGAVFTTETDTEVILAAYRCWGLQAFERFNGMWAMVLWDPARRRLVASRDRMGVKPLYVRRSSRTIAMASEVRALAAAGSLDDTDSWVADPNPAIVRDFLERGLTDHSRATFLAGIESVAPGHHLVIENGTIRDIRYWSPPVLSDDARPPSRSTDAADRELVSEFQATFDEAVRLRLRSDVPLGSCLSGGLDSSAIVRTTALLRDQGPVDPAGHQQVAQWAFHARFPADGVDESHFAELVARQSAVDLVYARTPERTWERLEQVVAAQGEPFASTSVMAQHTVMESAHDAGLKVLLDGQGADETLGGYDAYQGVRVASLLASGQLGGIWSELTAQARHAAVLGVAARAARGVAGPAARQLLRGVLAGRWGVALGPELQRHESLAAWHDLPGTPLARQLWQEIASESLPALLRYEDRNSMAFGIEARVPFLDYRLVELACRLPDRLRISRGVTKRILRLAMRQRLPREVVQRRDKMGFVVPQARWLTELRGPIAEQLVDGRLVARGWVASREVERLLSDPARHNAPLWRAVNVESWLRQLE